MKTKILLIVLLMFFVNVLSVNARETIKSCYKHLVWKGHNYYFFPDDGGRPYGSDIEILTKAFISS